jgi:hypothetical protein
MQKKKDEKKLTNEIYEAYWDGNDTHIPMLGSVRDNKIE